MVHSLVKNDAYYQWIGIFLFSSSVIYSSKMFRILLQVKTDKPHGYYGIYCH